MLPKIIWFMWMQGREAMPEVCALCLRSWEHWNPDFEIRFVDDANISEYVDLERLAGISANLSVQERSNLLRMLLLERYGGVWADATTYCTGPLHKWLPADVQAGEFFAYSFKNADRPMGNWFMAAVPGAYIVRTFTEHYIRFWKRSGRMRVVDEPFKKRIKSLYLGRIFNAYPWLWNSFLMNRVLGRYHYFIFHYLFGQCIRKDGAFAAWWNKVPYRSSYNAHELQRKGLVASVTPELQRIINDPDHKMFKLSWKVEVDTTAKDSIFAHLRSRLET